MVFLALRRDIRSSELLSESSLSCLRFRAAAWGLASFSESLDSREGTLLAVVLDVGLAFERASRMDGCLASGRETGQARRQDQEELLASLLHEYDEDTLEQGLVGGSIA